MHLNVWKTCRLDKISNRLLNECTCFITRPLTYIFDLSFKQKGNRSEPTNYRPVPFYFFFNSNYISDFRFGFLPGRSTTWQLLSVLEEWHEALDTGKSIHALFLDGKAFDRVDHNLFAHYQSVGVCGSSLRWIASYLCRRFNVTGVDGQLSSPRTVSSGVPQVSVLGSLFFILFFRHLL